jgi:histidinol phosphatase-like enzyme
MDDNKILFVDLDGTLIKEDLSNLAFSYSLKNHPFKTLFYSLVFLFKGKPYLKDKISKHFDIPFESLTFNKAAFDFVER